MGKFLLCAAVFVSTMKGVLGAGSLDIKFMTYRSNGRDNSGSCCDLTCDNPCDPYFKICIGIRRNCRFYNRTSGTFHEMNNINFGSSIRGLANPIVIPQDSIPDEFSVRVTGHDQDPTSGNDFIADVTKNWMVVDVTFNGLKGDYHEETFGGGIARFKVGFRVYCDVYHYGDKCDVYCKEDADGQYTCDPTTGGKVCTEGQTGPDCTTDINEYRLNVSCPDDTNCTDAALDCNGCYINNFCHNNTNCASIQDDITCDGCYLLNVCHDSMNCTQILDELECDGCYVNGSCQTGANCTEDCDGCYIAGYCYNGTNCTDIDRESACDGCLVAEMCHEGDRCSSIDWEPQCQGCEIDHVCQHGGVCANLPGGFNCTCQPGFEGLRQQALNYISKYMKVKYDVIDNLKDALRTFEAEITMTNTGPETIPGNGWEIFFCHLNLLEPDSLPSEEGAVLRDYGVRFMRTQGCLFKLELLDNFQPIPPGGVRRVRFLSENFSVSKSDGLPNWYVSSEGLEPRVLRCTAGESLDFVGDFDTPNKWKRYDYVEEDAEGHDRYDPFTPRVRYSMNKDTVDLGGSGHNLIPSPLKMAVNTDQMVSLQTKDWKIFSDGNFTNEARNLAERLGMNIVTQEPTSRYIRLTRREVEITLKDRETSSPEAYSINVQSENSLIEIQASAPVGIFYGVQTLLKLMDDEMRVPHVTIVDAPRYEYRGVMLDVARNFHSKERVMQLLDVMAMYKLNKLHWHLTDDEGWRLEVPGLEELTTVAGRRCHDPTETECILPFLGSGPTPSAPGSGFYTTDDYKEILRHATARHIEIIPEVDMPGHGHAVIKAMEARRQRLLTLNETAANEYVLVDNTDPSVYKSIQMYTDNAVNPCLTSTYRFISKIVQTLVDLHKDIAPLKIYHFGGDEVAKGAWENSTVCEQIFGSGFDIGDTKILKQLFVRQVANLTAQYGVDLAAWEDGVMESGSTPYERSGLRNKNVYGYAWDNIWEWGAAARAYKLANAGYKVVMAQATHLYFDHPYEPDPLERGLYWAPRYTDTRKTFGFMPMNMYANADVARSGDPLTKKDVCGEDLDGCIPLEKPENIVGMQGHLWSELVRNRDIADYMMFPRLLALAERAWHEAEWEGEEDNVTRQAMLKKDWEGFANTLGYRELKTLEQMGIKYRVPPPGAIVEDEILKTNVAYPGLTVEYSLDSGDTWCQASSPVPLSLAQSTRIQLRTRGANGARVSRVVNLYTAATINNASRPSGVITSIIVSIIYLVLV